MSPIEKLLEIMAALRNPESGCPWDLEQDFRSLIPYTIEETYEVADAIEREDFNDLKSELGDLLFQVVFYSQLATEKELFDFSMVADAISNKLVTRHPHVFAVNENNKSGMKAINNAEEQSQQWDKLKQAEREEKAKRKGENAGILDDISRTLPAMIRAEKMQRRAAREGFDWPSIEGVINKVAEELEEVRAEVVADEVEQERVELEMGDLLFSCINLARQAGVDPELSLRKANQKFERRFGQLERILKKAGKTPANTSLEDLEACWQQVKKGES